MSNERNEVRDRIVGCIVAGALGDAHGGPFENGTAAAPDRARRISDDTQLTLATCEAIGAGGRVEPEDVAARLLAWFRSGRLRGVGASTLQALRDLDAGAHWAAAGRVGDRAAGNGAAMRIAPLAFCRQASPQAGAALLRDVGSITHRNDEAIAGAGAIFHAIRCCFEARRVVDDLAERVASALPDTRVRDALHVAAGLPVAASVRIAASVLGCSGYVVESVPLAIFAAQRAQTAGLPEVFEEINDTRGDTDTIASMAGQVFGAGAGLAAIPIERFVEVDGIDEVVAVAEELAAKLAAPS